MLELRLDFAGLQQAPDIGVELRHDRRRRAGGRKHAIPRIGLESRQPDSAIVGKSGASVERFRLEIAIARTRLAFTWASATGVVAIISCTSPASSAVIAGPAPCKGCAR
jgi:hypothetical protein